MTQQSMRVIKLGGSLLDLPDLRERFEEWLSRQKSANSVLLIGGGTLVDEFRRLCQHVPVGEATAHWICVDLMSITARIASEMLDLPLTSSLQVLAGNNEELFVFDAADWLRNSQVGPCSWDVTSDSIAAFLATSLQAHELVLLKSKLPTASDPLSQPGFVDNHFSTAINHYRAAKVGHDAPVRFVNLRGQDFRETKLC